MWERKLQLALVAWKVVAVHRSWDTGAYNLVFKLECQILVTGFGSCESNWFSRLSGNKNMTLGAERCLDGCLTAFQCWEHILSLFEDDRLFWFITLL